jgi:hypothetical protein
MKTIFISLWITIKIKMNSLVKYIRLDLMSRELNSLHFSSLWYSMNCMRRVLFLDISKKIRSSLITIVSTVFNIRLFEILKFRYRKSFVLWSLWGRWPWWLMYTLACWKGWLELLIYGSRTFIKLTTVEGYWLVDTRMCDLFLIHELKSFLHRKLRDDRINAIGLWQWN